MLFNSITHAFRLSTAAAVFGLLTLSNALPISKHEGAFETLTIAAVGLLTGSDLPSPVAVTVPNHSDLDGESAAADSESEP
jgi:hypothetical protein